MNIKKIISVALSLCIASSCLTLTAYAKENTTLAINKSDISHEVSPMLRRWLGFKSCKQQLV